MTSNLFADRNPAVNRDLHDFGNDIQLNGDSLNKNSSKQEDQKAVMKAKQVKSRCSLAQTYTWLSPSTVAAI